MFTVQCHWITVGGLSICGGLHLCRSKAKACLVMIHLIFPFGSNAVHTCIVTNILACHRDYSNAVTTFLLTQRRFVYVILFLVNIIIWSTEHLRFTQVHTCLDRSRKIQQSLNPEQHLETGPVLFWYLNLNWGLVQVWFRFGISSEPDSGNTNSWVRKQKLNGWNLTSHYCTLRSSRPLTDISKLQNSHLVVEWQCGWYSTVRPSFWGTCKPHWSCCPKR
jgi:hypothetical protein